MEIPDIEERCITECEPESIIVNSEFSTVKFVVDRDSINVPCSRAHGYQNGKLLTSVKRRGSVRAYVGARCYTGYVDGSIDEEYISMINEKGTTRIRPDHVFVEPDTIEILSSEEGESTITAEIAMSACFEHYIDHQTNKLTQTVIVNNSSYMNFSNIANLTICVPTKESERETEIHRLEIELPENIRSMESRQFIISEETLDSPIQTTLVSLSEMHSPKQILSYKLKGTVFPGTLNVEGFETRIAYDQKEVLIHKGLDKGVEVSILESGNSLDVTINTSLPRKITFSEPSIRVMSQLNTLEQPLNVEGNSRFTVLF